MQTHSSAKYHAIPPSDNRTDPASDVDGDAVGGYDRFSIHGPAGTEAAVRWTYFLLGCAILLPWSAVMNGMPFFLSKLVGSPFYATFSSTLSSVYLLTKVVCQFYCTLTSKQSSPSRRIFTSITAAMLLVTSLCLSTFVPGTPLVFFLFALFIATSLPVTSAYICTAVYAGAPLLGLSFLQSAISGQAAIAVAISTVQVVSSMISLWGLSQNSVAVEVTMADNRDGQAEALAARIFFGVSALFLAATLVAYAWLVRQPFYKLSTNPLEEHCEVEGANELTGLVANVRRNPQLEASSRVFHVLRQNWRFMFSVAYAYVVTLAVFPAITVHVQPVNPSIHSILFTAFHFLVFNIGDLVGRYTCSNPHLIVRSANKILVLSLLRTLFVPPIVFCNVHRPGTVSLVSPIINSDICFMIILLMMGYTNGYVSALALLAVSSLEHNPGLEGRREHVDIAATLGASFANVGLAVGSLSSFAVQTII